jgi:hypothetical protein
MTPVDAKRSLFFYLFRKMTEKYGFHKNCILIAATYEILTILINFNTLLQVDKLKLSA